MPKNMGNKRQGIANIPYICHQHGMQNIIICPGSRNAPLILSFIDYNKINIYSIVDERSACYVALGMSLHSNKPTGIICTSGTAVLNLAPAIAEAYYQHKPLIVFTADRPAELIDQGDGQSIRQRNVFQNFIKHSFEIPVETDNEIDVWHCNRIISQAIDTAITFPIGPVHVNIPLREPLYDKNSYNYDTNTKTINTINVWPKLTEESEKYVIEKWNRSSKKIIVVGSHEKNENLNYLLNTLIDNHPDTLIFAENISNFYNKKFIYSPERFFSTLNESERQNLCPDLLITIGNAVVSKRLKQYLRTYSNIEHWIVDRNNPYMDTFQSLRLNIPVDPIHFFNLILKECQSNRVSQYQKEFTEKDKNIFQKHNEFFENIDFSDFFAIKTILEKLPSGSLLHLSNSTPVRHSQLFPTREDIEYYSNRGVSGIDGCVSTAAGSSIMVNEQVFLIAGDLAFLYDSNGLWNKYIKDNFKIIVINNNGGNIFRLIDSSSLNKKYLQYFETPYSASIGKVSEAFGFDYFFANNKSSLEIIIDKLINNKNKSVLEIKTDPIINEKIFKEYYKFLKS